MWTGEDVAQVLGKQLTEVCCPGDQNNSGKYKRMLPRYGCAFICLFNFGMRICNLAKCIATKGCTGNAHTGAVVAGRVTLRAPN